MNAPAAQGSRPVPVALIVEDDASYLLQLQKVFRMQGMSVIQAIDGISGLQAAFEHLPDVIVADVGMPVLSGPALSRLLKTAPLTSEIPVILLCDDTEQALPSWHAHTLADHLIDKFDDVAVLLKTAWTEIEQRGYPGARARAAVAAGASGGNDLIENLVVQEMIRAEVTKLAQFTTAGNRHQMARGLFDVLQTIVDYRAAGVFFPQPGYSTFFLHTQQSLPSHQLNGLLSCAVAPLRGALQNGIRLELFSGDEQTPRELGRWTPHTAPPQPDLPILTSAVQRGSQLLGSIALIPATPDRPQVKVMLAAFAEHFAPILAGLYLFEECLLQQRELAAAKSNDAPPREPEREVDLHTMIERLLQGNYGRPNPAQRRALEAALRIGEDRTLTHEAGESLPVAGPLQPQHAQPPGREPTDLLQLVRDVCTSVQPAMQQQRLRFEARIPATAPTVVLDRAGIAAALTTLLQNAITYTQPGGKVTLWVIVEGQQIRIAVQDTGVGIDPARQQDVFRARHSRTEGALGPGLAASRAIAEDHGGTIIVDSTPGKGSLFILSISLQAGGPAIRQGAREGAA